MKKNQKKKRSLWKLRKIQMAAMAAGIMMAVSGCGAQQADPQVVSQEKQKDSVIIAIGTEPETLDPTQGWGHGNAPIVQSTLIRYNADLSFEHDLATDYALSEDGLVWTFTLRDNAYFSDGEKVTASDVVFTLEKAREAQSAVDLTYVKEAVAVDEATVQISLERPTSVFLNTLASIGIVPEHAYGEDYGRNPIGSGPYQFVEWKPQEQIIFTANEHYYGGVPEIRDVTVVFMSEDAALAAVKAGTVDVAYSSAALATVEVDGYEIEAIPSADNRGFTMPLLPADGRTTADGAPVGNDVTCHREIRQAVAYALDRQQIADTVLNGFGKPAYSENDGMPWNHPETVIETDVAYAKKLLEEAGWKDVTGDGIVEKDGLEAAFTCIYPAGDSVRQGVAMAAAEQAEQVGIRIRVEGLSWDEISRRMFSDAVMMGWGSAIPNETYYLYHSGSALLDDFYNPEGYTSPLTDGYLEAAMNALTVEEANENWKKVQWDGTTGTSMKGECPWIWIVNLDHVTYVREGLSIGDQPVHGHGHGLPLIQNLEEWEWEEE